MKRQFTKLLAMMLSILLIASFVAGCGSSGNNTTKGTSANASTGASNEASTTAANNAPEPVTLKITANFNGFTDNQDRVTQEIKRLTNIQLEYVDCNQDKYKLLAVSNDLGDITTPSTAGAGFTIDTFIKGKQIIQLDDLLQTHGQNLLKGAAASLQVQRDYLSSLPEAKGHVYDITAGSIVDMQAYMKQESYEISMGPYIRWDYYNEIGAPAINNEDDLLSALAKMQKAHPKTSDGKKVYGLAAWGDWGSFGYMNWYQNCHNYGISMNWLTASQTDYAYQPNMLYPDSQWWKAIAFLYKANKMGLLDPESFTMKGDEAANKVKSGNLLMIQHSWSNQDINAALAQNFGPDAGMGCAYGAFPGYYGNAGSSFGAGTTFAITSTCKTPERAMDFINWLATPEATRLIQSGVEGQDWSIVNGKAEYTDDTIKAKLNDPDYTKKSGVKREILRNMTIVAGSNLDDNGTPLDLDLTEKWFTAKTDQSPFYSAYCKQLGISYPGQIVDKLAAEGKCQWYNFDTASEFFFTPMPDDLNRISAKVFDQFTKDYPKMILASSDEEFNKIKADAIAGYKTAGGDQVDTWFKGVLDNANKLAAGYKSNTK